MDDDYFFSEREVGVLSRTSGELDDAAWGGIVALIHSQLSSNAFSRAFPYRCDDKGRGIIDTDEGSFWLALHANVPDAPERLSARDVPSITVAMDILEFMARHVSEAEESRYHPFPEHYHLKFDDLSGLTQLRHSVNRIFRRSGLAFEMDMRGRVMRLAQPVLLERIDSPLPKTGRPTLDDRLARAIEKYRSPDASERRESLEKLWDAWEEIKSLHGNKQVGIDALIAGVAVQPTMVAALGDDAKALTALGNQLPIRHSEADLTPIEDSAQVDYLFGRLFNMIWLLLPGAALAD